MYLRPYADAVAAAGRNGDTTLVHMTPDEVEVLNRMGIMSGLGSLPRNPVTGYPEANFLEKLFKGIGSSLPGILGTMFLGPIGGALAQGLFTGATTDNWKKGLLAGLGTFAAGNILNAGAGAVKGATAGAQASKAAQEGLVRAGAESVAVPGMQTAGGAVTGTTASTAMAGSAPGVQIPTTLTPSFNMVPGAQQAAQQGIGALGRAGNMIRAFGSQAGRDAMFNAALDDRMTAFVYPQMVSLANSIARDSYDPYADYERQVAREMELLGGGYSPSSYANMYATMGAGVR